MKDVCFRLEDLRVGYAGRAILPEIRVDIERGEILTLIGPNGAGKSTILKTITRQLEAVGGRVWLADRDLSEISYAELSRHMAVMLTERRQPELMTCRDVAAMGRTPYTGQLGILTAADEEKVEEALRAVHAEEIAGRDFGAVSDGERQRVLLARALCQEPEILVLDEPTSFLDIRHKLELLSLLRELAKRRGITVILSLHEIDLAIKLSDRILCVRRDGLLRCGTPEELCREEEIRELYGVSSGFFDPLLGSLELPAPAGEPRVLVLSNCGSGIPVYRRLQREGTPFIAGILTPGDLDYQVARLLAARVIMEEPYRPISDRAFREAAEAIERCERVIDAGVVIGESNARMRELLAMVRRKKDEQEK